MFWNIVKMNLKINGIPLLQDFFVRNIGKFYAYVFCQVTVILLANF